jgi:HSP20 family protein
MNTTLSRTEESQAATAQDRPLIRPRYTVEGDDTRYWIRVELPGVAKDQAGITLEKDTLTVEAHRGATAAGDWQAVHREIAEADYRLSLQLNLRVDDTAIKAQHKDGVLTIELPLAEEAKPRSISID